MAVEVQDVSISLLGSDPTAGLAPGPISPLEPSLVSITLPPFDFTGLVAGALGVTAPEHDRIDGAQQVIAAASDPQPFDTATAGAVSDAAEAHAVQGDAFNAADPSDVIDATNAQSGAVDGNRGNYNDSPPAPLPVPDPPPPPTGTEPGGGGI